MNLKNNRQYCFKIYLTYIVFDILLPEQTNQNSILAWWFFNVMQE